MIKIGIVGCGTIGNELIKAIKKDFKGSAKLTAVCDIDEKKAHKAIATFKQKPKVTSLESVVKMSDLVVEAASAAISSYVAKKALIAGKEVMIMSVGGLLGRNDIFRLANQKKKNLYLPSGALCGLDGLKSANRAKITEVMLITKKPPRALEGAPYVLKNEINLNLLKRDTVIFSGSVKGAIKGFPQNINVSAVVSLAGIGAKKTAVKIICSPKAKINSHTLIVKGDFGELTTRTNNLPSPNNPKTSYLAVLSAIATLKMITEYVRVGN